MTQKILLTGGYGFVGNEVARQAKALGCDITILDNKSRVAPQIDDILSLPLLEVDIRDRAQVEVALSKVKPTTVFHLAAMHFIPECNAHPDQCLRVNVEGTLNVLEASARAGVQRVVLTSSGAIYADSSQALSLSHPVAPVDIYGLSKRFCEELAAPYARHFKDGIKIIRLFNVIGPRETNKHIAPEIIAQLKNDGLSKDQVKLKLGNVETYRDYIDVVDAAAGFLKIGLSPSQGNEQNSVEIFNLGTGNAYSVRQLINEMGEALAKKIEIEIDPSRFRPSDKMVQLADISATTIALGWNPKSTFPQSVRKLLQWEKLLP